MIFINMMGKIRPIIKFNGGNPLALCNRCFVIMCYVRCAEEDGEYCKVIILNGDKEGDYTSTPIGDTPPLYCDKCIELLSYSINE